MGVGVRGLGFGFGVWIEGYGVEGVWCRIKGLFAV